MCPLPYPDIYPRFIGNTRPVKKSIRVVFDKQSGKTEGFNLMGIRYRQDVCEKWIRIGAPVEAVLEQLGLANFDPEFFDQYETDLVDIYNRQFGKNIRLKQKRSLPAVLRFLQQPENQFIYCD